MEKKKKAKLFLIVCTLMLVYSLIVVGLECVYMFHGGSVYWIYEGLGPDAWGEKTIFGNVMVIITLVYFYIYGVLKRLECLKVL